MFKKFEKHPKLFFINVFLILNLLFVGYLFLIKPKLKKKDDLTELVTSAMAKRTKQEANLATSEIPDNKPAANLFLIDSVYNKMSPTERASQMIMIGTSEKYGIGLPYSQVKALVKNKLVGGVLFLKGNSEHFKSQRIELDTLSKADAITQWYACDCEPTLFHKKFIDMDSVLPASQLQTTELLDSTVGIINKRIKEMGLQINFAPVSDIAVNQEIINQRSFGNNPEKIEELSNEFIELSRQKNIFCGIKHFPGHGAVTGDTHKGTVYIDGDLTELSTFKNIIQKAQPDFVMIGHMSVENNPKYATNGKPCSISKTIVTNLLKEEIGFNGIAITDAMNMAAVKKYPNADWQAILAGNDIVLMPMNAAGLNQQIKQALLQNNALSKQLEKSIKKIIALKLSMKN